MMVMRQILTGGKTLVGMQTVWVFGDTQEIKSIPFPDVNAYLTYGGEANGNATHDPEVYPYFEP